MKLAAILLLLLLSFNFAGYRLVFLFLQKSADQTMAARLDAEHRRDACRETADAQVAAVGARQEVVVDPVDLAVAGPARRARLRRQPAPRAARQLRWPLACAANAT